ncbi:MAG: PSD1 and planctomycete cytochrome C domain-containing protein [Isosphaeraceae bacterium]|nr:PSD1 and planctomycete cytochrome C domain-containing protein [Isosphaeraceae bacterium]
MHTLLASLALLLPASADAGDQFERSIRPILAEHCIACHGSKSQKGGLRLDSREAIVRGGDSGPAIEAGDLASSLILEAVGYGSEPKMPPKGKLRPEQIDALKQWVAAGAPWPKTVVLESGPAGPDPRTHWAFQPVSAPSTPEVARADWPRTSIDRFVLRELERKGLAPSLDADRPTWLRRVTFDLIGLPPTLDEIAAFEADRSDEAHSRVVERLLASPHYGERWGRHWLDVARYADTKGYVFMQDPNYHWAWTYRDYVIRSLNADKPYDRFIQEQIAADQLEPAAERDAIAALGFITVGSRFINNQQDIIDDRIDVVSRGILGLTVACARCHDHKFDPIPAEDYYSLYGVFASSNEPEVPPPLGDPAKHAEYANFERELKVREAALAAYRESKYAELQETNRRRSGEYLVAASSGRDRPNTREFMLIADGSDLNPRMINAWRRFLDSTRGKHDPIFAPFHALVKLPAEGFAKKADALLADYRAKPAADAPINPVVLETLSSARISSLTELARTYSNLLHSAHQQGHELARRKNGGKEAVPLPEPAWEELRLVFERAGCPTKLGLDQLNDLQLLPDRPSQAKLRELREKVEKWRDSGPGAPPRAMALVDAPSPGKQRVFLRGNPGTPGAEVPRRFLRLTSTTPPPAFTRGSGRGELARAVTDPGNPLTARVFVNRVWMHHLGTPLVSTPSDFGLRSDPPTNPALLDHLASRFMSEGWSIKQLHRAIVLSRTYRQASLDRPDARAIDPENTLYWRFNRRRLDFESTRDALLAVSGRLDPTVGGRSVDDMMNPGPKKRRTLYGKVDRLNLPGVFRTFDFPDPAVSNAKRDQTTVAPQALALMNHPLVMDCAKAIADATSPSAGEPKSRVAAIYRAALHRDPAGDEVETALAYLAAAGPEAPARLAHALLMSNEFVMID